MQALDAAEESALLARTLQESLLPPHLPDIPGLQVAARYLRGGRGADVLGDFYDVFHSVRGSWGVVLGDMAGKGLQAAKTTAMARVHAAGRRGRRPCWRGLRLGRAGTLTNGRLRTSVAGMAKRTRVELVDDLDGSPAQESVTFGLDGLTFEIDLSAGNAAGLREALACYVDAARRIRFEPFVARGRARTPVARRPVADRERLAAIRGWAAAQGREVKDRGRISAEVVAAYEEAQRMPPASADPPKRTRRGTAAPAARPATRRP